jgi:hypothetical protein
MHESWDLETRLETLSVNPTRRLWLHGFVLAVGAYSFQSFRFGGTWGVAELAGVVLFWTAVVLLIDRRVRRDLCRRPARPLERILQAAAAGLIVGLIAFWAWRRMSWSQLWTAALAAQVGWLLRRPLAAALWAERRTHELERWALLVVSALWLISPYATTHLVGAGDAEHYVRQLADFLAQIRHGTFPVFVGQSRFAFDGAVHPLRTAPYFPYVGGLLDVGTGFSLTPVELQNLLIVLSYAAAVFCSYWTLAQILPRRRWTCVWLALLFATSPGVLALIYGGDMVATWMTLPWLPLLFFGWYRSWRREGEAWGLLLQALALAMIWLAHAPVAMWATALTVVSEGSRLLLQGRRAVHWYAALGASLLALLCCHYVFVSVLTLEVPENPYLAYATRHGLITEVLREGWTGPFRLVSPSGDRLLTDLHLSPGLWVAALVGLLGLRAAGRAGLVMAGSFVMLMVLMIPGTGLSESFWSHLSPLLATITEKWPMQRFYPLLSAMLPVLAALSLRRGWFSRPRIAWGARLVLGTAVVWSGWEARKFRRHGHEATLGSEATWRLLLPENNKLSRYSCEMWGQLPHYFSFGHMNPVMHNRLLDPAATKVLESNLRFILRTTPRMATHRRLTWVPTRDGGYYSPKVVLQPGQSVILRFDFETIAPRGTVVLSGRRTFRCYVLPFSGGEGAFGPLPSQIQAIGLQNHGMIAERVEVRFVRDGPADDSGLLANVDVIPFSSVQLPFQLISLIPYDLRADVREDGWLETPKLMIPGYCATLDGRAIPIERSPDGLVMIQVKAGQHQIRIDYHPPWSLTVSFWLNFAGIGAVSALVILKNIRRTSLAAAILGNDGLARIGRWGLVAGVVFIFVIGVVWFSGRAAVASAGPGVIQLSVRLPVGRHGVYESLVAIADNQGNRTSVVIFYESDRAIRLGCRKNGILKVLSGPLPVSYFPTHVVEVFAGPLLTDSDRACFPNLNDQAWTALRQTIRVRFNHLAVWETDAPYHGNGPFRLALGDDPFDPAFAAAKFRGRIMKTVGASGL